jgi:hypothetical protein
MFVPKNMRNYLLVFILINLSKFTQAQTSTVSSIASREDSLLSILTALRSQTSDNSKDSINSILEGYMHETLLLPNAFEYKFDKLKTIGFVDSPDNRVRIVNWNVELSDQTQRYSCFVMKKEKNTVFVNELKEDHALPLKPEGLLDQDHWYGALYYKVIPKQKGSKQTYILLGWDGNNASSTIKLIDVLYFVGGKPKLGSPVFKLNKITVKRLFFEHSKKVSMSLKYEPEYDRIIYDHLSPESPALEGYYSFYVPDLSYDALYFKDDKWELKEDVIGVNGSDEQIKSVYVKNEKNGKIEKLEIENKWQSPEDSKAPVGGNEHKAALPENKLPSNEEKGDQPLKKTGKRDKRDPSMLNTTTGRKGHKNRKRN